MTGPEGNPPPVIVSCGEPAGIGPEIAIKAWTALRDTLPFVWIGDPAHLPQGAPHRLISDAAQAAQVAARALPVLAHRFPAPVRPGQPAAENAAVVVAVVARAVALVQSGAGAALCTAPIHKQALHEGAGFGFPGHTEYLAHLAGDVPVAMMLAAETLSPPLRVVPATIHIALAKVPRAFTPALLRQTVLLTRAALQTDFAIANPRIAVSGLNPHAGEGGAMGHEEIAWMLPLLAELRGEGLNVSGPHPADTLFHPAARARYDAAICAYHDQALIPIKTLDMAGGVNLTLGLPFVRTSPDHGTAFDIAGKDIADPASMIAALRMAAGLGARRSQMKAC